MRSFIQLPQTHPNFQTRRFILWDLSRPSTAFASRSSKMRLLVREGGGGAPEGASFFRRLIHQQIGSSEGESTSPSEPRNLITWQALLRADGILLVLQTWRRNLSLINMKISQGHHCPREKPHGYSPVIYSLVIYSLGSVCLKPVTSHRRVAPLTLFAPGNRRADVSRVAGGWTTG